MSTTELTQRSTKADVEAESEFETEDVVRFARVDQRYAWYNPVKAVVEYAAAVVLFLLAIPFVAVAAACIKLTSRGPVFYRQTRLGKDGRRFDVIKLRTMVQNAEAGTGAVWSTADDPRVTRVGRFLRNSHIDEFPQLINVLLGQMALIGPRPERPEIVEQLEWHVPEYRQRLKVRPGITGLAQLKLPADVDIPGVQRKLLHDLYYIRHQSPWLDLRILMVTGWLLTKTMIKSVFRFARLPSSDSVQLGAESIVGKDSELLSCLQEDEPSAEMSIRTA